MTVDFEQTLPAYQAREAINILCKWHNLVEPKVRIYVKPHKKVNGSFRAPDHIALYPPLTLDVIVHEMSHYANWTWRRVVGHGYDLHEAVVVLMKDVLITEDYRSRIPR